jgi:hypothetical protein
LSTRELILAKLKKNSVDSYKDEPTKPTEPSFEGFDGSLSHESGDFFRTDDEPHIKVLAWLYQKHPPGKRCSINRARIAEDCRLSIKEVREAIIRLIREGDLEPSTERRRETFILKIQYHEEEAKP